LLKVLPGLALPRATIESRLFQQKLKVVSDTSLLQLQLLLIWSVCKLVGCLLVVSRDNDRSHRRDDKRKDDRRRDDRDRRRGDDHRRNDDQKRDRDQGRRSRSRDRKRQSRSRSRDRKRSRSRSRDGDRRRRDKSRNLSLSPLVKFVPNTSVISVSMLMLGLYQI